MEKKAEAANLPANIVNIEEYAMTVQGLTDQVQFIQEVMNKVMNEDEHYGTIPGTKKPTLYKPGAEKLCLTFRLDPDYEIIREVRENAFIAYTVKCILIHIPSGANIASGIGSCNSRETKYRWRHIEESTGVPVPKAYWDARTAGDNKEMKRLLEAAGSKGGEIGAGTFRAAKIDGAWVVATAEQVENDNPWDLDNTFIKMACKRALVAATLNATAASDIFTQDLEDMPRGTVQEQKEKPKKKAKPKAKPAAKETPDDTNTDKISFKNKVLCPPGGSEAGNETNTSYCHSVCKQSDKCDTFQEAIA